MTRPAATAAAADDERLAEIRISPLRGPLGGAIWSLTGAMAATLAWELALLRDLPSLRVFVSGWWDSLMRAGPIILPAFVGCYAAYWTLRRDVGGTFIRRRGVAAAFSTVWHFGAHWIVVALLSLLHRGAPAYYYSALPLIVGCAWGAWLIDVTPASRSGPPPS